MNGHLMGLIGLVLVTASLARADDRAACQAGDDRACARLGQLKQAGALKNGTKDIEALVTGCSRALEQAAGPTSMRAVNRACAQVFSPELQKGWNAVVGFKMPGQEAILATAWAEAYCPRLQTKTIGCEGKRSANFGSLSTKEALEALKQLTKASLGVELSTEQASTLGPRFARAWDVLLGAP